MAIDMHCSVNMVFFRDSIVRNIWTSFVQPFHIKFRYTTMEAIENVLSGNLHTFSPLVSSFNYVVDVKGIALPFASYVSKRKLTAHFSAIAKMMVCPA